MKSIFLSTLIATIPSILQAQLSQGLKQAGGSISFYQDKTENEYVVSSSPFASVFDELIDREYSFNAGVGFFIKENVSLGFGLGYTHIFNRTQLVFPPERNASFENEIRTNLFEMSFFSRFHKFIFEKFYLYVEPSASISLGSTENEFDVEASENVFGYGARVRPGMVFFISDHFGLETSFGSLGYERVRRKLDDPTMDSEPKNIDSNYGLDVSLRTFQFGLQYYF